MPSDVAAAGPPGSVIRVSVVDDQALFRDVLVKMLATVPGMVVVGEAKDGEEGVRQALRLRPDLVLMDIGLPALDGLEATRRIKQAAPAIRVMALTAYPSEDAFRRALGAGVDSFVLKDANLDELVATIRLTCGGNRLFNGQLLSGFLASPREPKLPHGLTRRELEVLQALAAGHSNRAIASRLRIRDKTVRNHLSNIYTKLAVKGRAQAVLFALRSGLVGSPDLALSPR